MTIDDLMAKLKMIAEEQGGEMEIIFCAQICTGQKDARTRHYITSDDLHFFIRLPPLWDDWELPRIYPQMLVFQLTENFIEQSHNK
tara:strand:- start:324 stop:581 length:258 start_codon:yes stop_codon:yes gene_type:complete